MPAPTPITPAERFAGILQCLSNAVVAMGGGNRLPSALIALIVTRIREIKQRVARIVARIQAGTYAFRRVAAPHRPATKPRPVNPLPHGFGWLRPLLPLHEVNAYRSQLELLLQDPGMVALVQTAPASLRRPLRSACHMLGLRPPPLLALPARPRPPRKTPPAPSAAPPPEPKPPQPQAPAWLKDRRKPWSLARIRGSPHRA